MSNITLSYTPVAGTPVIELPRSKSIAARVACLDYLCGLTPCAGADAGTDERVITCALRRGFRGTDIDLGESGTAMRLLTALAAATPDADVVLHGTRQLMQRPMRPLLEALNSLGALPVERISDTAFRVRGTRLRSRGITKVNPSVSSQFVSALLLAAPLIDGGLRLQFTAAPVSKPYIDMTISVLRRYSVVASEHQGIIAVDEGECSPPAQRIEEPDWSAASYFYEAALITGRSIAIKGLRPHGRSLQGDSKCEVIFSQLGVATENLDGHLLLTPATRATRFDACMTHVPDLVPAVVAACAATGISLNICGVEHLQVKESARLSALATELAKVNIALTVTPAGTIATLRPQMVVSHPLFSPHADHRMAMALAPIAALGPIAMENPQATRKSFPSFWHQLTKLGYTS